MSLTQLKNLTGFEVSLVPQGANGKKRFLVTKEHGELSMKDVLEQILKEGLKDEEAIDKVAKNLGLDEDKTKALKAIMKIVGAESSPLAMDDLKKALDAMTKKEDGKEDDKKEAEGDDKKDDDEATKTSDEPDSKVEKQGEPPREGGTMSGKVPVQKEDGSWDLSKVDESIRPSLEVVCKAHEKLSKAHGEAVTKNRSLADELMKERDARVLKEFEEKARSYGHIGEDATKLAKVLKSVYDANPENGEAVEEILKSANAKIEESSLFEEQGTTGVEHNSSNTWGKIEKMADELRGKETSLTQEEAVTKILERNPKLYQDYAKESGRVS